MTDPTGPSASQAVVPEVDRTVKFYRIRPDQRVEYVATMIGRNVTGEYRHGNARVPFTGRLTVAYDPIRQLWVAVIIDPDDPLARVLALNLSSLHTIQPTGDPA